MFHSGFSNLLKDYIAAECANGGRDSYLASVSVIEAIERDWNLFHQRVSPQKLNHFLPSVFEGKEPPFCSDFSRLVVPLHRNAMSTAYGKWLDFWLIDRNSFSNWPKRYAPNDIETAGTFVSQAASHLKDFVGILPHGWRLWRSRGEYLGSSEWDCRPLPLNEMGHNPKCPQSRLNREGETVLYCAETEKTAIAEIRPGRGYICTTCELALTRELKVIDLAAPLHTLNPFTTTDLTWRLDLQRVARNLGEEIAKPISRAEDPFVYSKTQFLAMVVRAMKLAGVRFRSSLDSPNGVNLALFDPAAVTFSNCRLVTITHTDISFDRLNPRTLSGNTLKSSPRG
ncbi:MAG TPA: RES family NAD+ phosphorylase [Candidatus Angelobacter sp.]|nr:RES family NAD+ phosphorylase [Candidatus Angelobacter sp.]